jgi:hypothetical protein
MAHRWGLLALGLLAASLHAMAVAQTLLPAQDGLKFIRIARQFQVDPWSDVVRGSDAHPLYPALIALAEPIAAGLVGRGPDAWRIAAQGVSVVAAVGLVIPIYFLTRSLFDRATAILAAAIAGFLPRVAELGRDTLADSLGLFATFLALMLGARALRDGHRWSAVGSGLAAGLGYLARPEVILAPGAIGLAWIVGLGRRSWRSALAGLPAVVITVGATLALVGSYAVVKGEISEKLAVRHGAALGPQRILIRSVPQQVPRGLDDPRWDFSPKEETDHIAIRDWKVAASRIGLKWWEDLCWFFAVMTIWGLLRQRYARSLSPDRDGHAGRPRGVEGRLLLLFIAVHATALIRHSADLGYLSGRHVMPLVLAATPWAAAGTLVCGRSLAGGFAWGPRPTRCVGIGILALAIAASAVVQLRPAHLNHLSRWAHWTAGRWLATNARPDEVILDTRGWARFISGRPGYDYWHVRQALTDSHLAYVLVGLDELQAESPRASTLKALLDYAATPLAEFSGASGMRGPAVRLYRFHRPDSWEGLAP